MDLNSTIVKPMWTPIPDLARDDADISLILLFPGAVVYPEPVNDPFFASHRQRDELDPSHMYYGSDNLLNAMACAEQVQFRNPTTGEMTATTTPLKAWNDIGRIGLNRAQNATAYRLMDLVVNSELYFSVARTEGSLEAYSPLMGVVSIGLPDNQWQVEAISWFKTALAAMQVQTLTFISKSVEGLKPLRLARMETPELAATCDTQIIRNAGGYQSFSVLGVSLIIVIGMFIIVISLFLDTFVGYLRSTFNWSPFKGEAWRTDSMLHQQSLAFEGYDMVKWSHSDTAIPTTEGGEFFPRLKL